MISLTLLLGLALSGAPPAPAAPALAACPAENEQSHRLAFGLATAPDYLNARTLGGLPLLTAADVHVLTDDPDAAKCQEMLAYVEWIPDVYGGSNEGTTTVFYKAGDRYLAVVTVNRPTPPPPPAGYVRLRTGFTLVYVFDSALVNVVPLAL